METTTMELAPMGDSALTLNCQDPQDLMKGEMFELKLVISQLMDRYKQSEDKRRVMERRNTILLKDNNELLEQWQEAQKKRLAAEKEVTDLQQKLDHLTNILLGKSKKSTSTSTSDLCPPKEDIKSPKKIRKKEITATSVILSKQELDQLESQMRELRDALEAREATWAKLSDRERMQRLRLSKLSSENMSLKSANKSKSSELDYKNRKLKAKIIEVNSLKKELSRLKGGLSPGFRIDRRPKMSKGPKLEDKIEKLKKYVKKNERKSLLTLSPVYMSQSTNLSCFCQSSSNDSSSSYCSDSFHLSFAPESSDPDRIPRGSR